MSKQNLLLALDDEYKAYSFYGLVSSYGQIFVNLQSAEQTHIDALKWHLQNLGVAIPANPYNVDSFANFSSIEEILQTALANEKANVELYNTLTTNESDSGVLDTFYRLQAASFNRHIPALQNALIEVQSSTAQDCAQQESLKYYSSASKDSMQNLQQTIKTFNDAKVFLNEAGEMIEKMQNGNLSQMELESFLSRINYSLVGGVIIGALGASLLNEFLNQNKE